MTRSLLFLALFAGAALSARSADFAGEVFDATFKFSNRDSTATCFLIRREAPDAAVYLVTAQHVLEDAKGENFTLVLRERQADGSYERRDLKLDIRRGATPLWVRHETQDIAALRITEALPGSPAALPESALADETSLADAGARLCGPLYLLAFPARLEGNKAGIPIARQGIFATPPVAPLKDNPTFLADLTTFAGDSGGPVFIAGRDEHPLIVGLMVARNQQDVRSQSDYEERVFRFPLGLGTVVRSQFIRETVEAAAKASEATP